MAEQEMSDAPVGVEADGEVEDEHVYEMQRLRVVSSNLKHDTRLSIVMIMN